ncbi:hypothetical protein GGF31_002376 [Allomyces arbusculus]|nr:hypothetical protein GGF31_002376 [Allomyces arbusculus]
MAAANPAGASALQELQNDLLRLVDVPAADVPQLIASLRPRLRVADIIKSAPAPDMSSQQAVDRTDETRALAVEVFQTVFEVHDGLAHDAEKVSAVARMCRDVLNADLVGALIARIKQIQVQHKSIVDKPAAKDVENADEVKRRALASLVRERLALGTLLHTAVCFAVPDNPGIKAIIDLAASVEMGDALSISLAMTLLACMRVSNAPPAPAHQPPRAIPRVRDLAAPPQPAAAPAPAGQRAELASVQQLHAVRQDVKNTNFKQSGLKNTALLALAVAEAGFRRDANDDRDEPVEEKAVLGSDALPWLITQVLVNLSKPYDPLSTGIEALYRSIPKSSATVTRYVLGERLEERVRNELRQLASHVIKRLSKTLDTLRKAEDKQLEDAQMAAELDHRPATPGAAGGARAAAGAAPPALIRSDFEIFSLFLSLLHEGRAQDCQVFWSGETAYTTFGRFLQYASAVMQRRLQQTGYNLIASLVNDQLSASKAFTDLHNRVLGSITWADVVSAIQHYVTEFKKIGPQAVPSAEFIPQRDVDLLTALLRLMRQVCRFDENARRTILLMNGDVLSLLFDLFVCTVPVRLKASVLEAIGAFVSHEAGMPLEDLSHVSQRIWSYMEAIAMVPQVSFAIGKPAAGIKQELTEREAPLKHYPLTMAYLQLLEHLTPRPTPATTALVEPPTASSASATPSVAMYGFALVDNLGATHRAPGVFPYFDYMVSDLFLKVETREFLDVREQWAQWRVCLGIVYHALCDLDVVMAEALSDKAANGTAQPSTLFRMLSSHPAFQMLSDILDGKPLLDGILRVVSRGREAIEEEEAAKEERAAELTTVSALVTAGTDAANGTAMETAANDKHNALFGTFTRDFDGALLLAYRILHQVMLMQSTFLHRVLPQVGSVNGGLLTSSKRELDRLLASRQHALVDLIFFIRSPDTNKFMDDLSILSIQILSALSVAPTYQQSSVGAVNSLVSILSGSDLGKAITMAYQDRFDNPDMVADPLVHRSFGEVEIKSVRLAMLKLLVTNLRTKAVPTIAHFLLGLTKEGRLYLQDPNVADQSLFMSIVRAVQLNQLPLALQEPAQEMLYHLVAHPATHQLSASLKAAHFYQHLIESSLRADQLAFATGPRNARTSPFMRMIPSTSQFGVPDLAASMVLATPSKSFFSTSLSSSLRRSTAGGAAHPDVHPTTPEDAAKQVLDTVAVLGTWTWLLKSLAVQVKTNHDHQSYLTDLVTALFKTPDAAQSRMLSVLAAVMNVTVPEVASPAGRNEIGSKIDDLFALVANQHQGWPTMVNTDGCTVYDLKACDHLARQVLASSASSASAGQANAMFATPRPGAPLPASTPAAGAAVDFAVLEGVMLILNHENRKRRVYHAQVQAVTAWVQLLSVTFLTNVEVLGDDLRDVTRSLLAAVSEQLKASPTECKEHYSKALVLLLSVLDRMTATTEVDQLLLTQLLRNMLDVIKSSDASIVVRGNLYAALLVFLSFTSTDAVVVDLTTSMFSRSMAAFGQSQAMALGASVGLNRSAIRVDSSADRMENNTQVLLRNHGGDKLLDILCRDATHTGLWQMVALSLLDVLTAWSFRDAPRHWVLEYLHAHNYLMYFVRAVDELQPQLTYLTSSEDVAPDELPPLFIYESLMALLLRLSLNKVSCERLLAVNAVGKLAEGTFLSYRVGTNLAATQGVAFAPGASTMGASFAGAAATDAMDWVATSKQADPYQYFSATAALPLDRVSETLVRYNQVLQPVLDLVVTVSSVLPHTPGSAHVAAVARLVARHQHSLVRIVRACVNLTQDAARAPAEDNELEMALLRQTAQICRIVQFLAKNKANVAPDLTELLPVLFMRCTRLEFARRDRPTQAEKLVIQMVGNIVGYCLVAVSDSQAAATANGSASAPALGSSTRRPEVDVFAPNASLRATAAAASNNAAPATADRPAVLFDPDLSTATRDRYYSTSTRPTLGLLVLYMTQVVARVTDARKLAQVLEQKLREDPARLTVDDWRAYVADMPRGDVTHQIAYDVIPARKRADVIRRAMQTRLRHVGVEAASNVRALEMAMTVLYLHVRYYTSGAVSAALANSAAQAAPVRTSVFGETSATAWRARASGRLAMDLNSLRNDASTVVPKLKTAIAAIPWAEENDARCAFLVHLCNVLLERIEAFKPPADL